MDFSIVDPRIPILNLLKSDQNILAVSKLQPIEKIRNLYKFGQKHFAENYIQEALDKIEKTSDLNIEWHLIGPIQSNKVKFLKNKFSYIHSVDSLKLAEKISSKALEINYIQKIFLQINLSNEATKSGLDKNTLMKEWSLFKQLAGIQIVGLMTMPPLENEPEKNRIYFKELKKISSELKLDQLSMGTSQDYLVALQEGSNWIRIGTLLFGERKRNESIK